MLLKSTFSGLDSSLTHCFYGALPESISLFSQPQFFLLLQRQNFFGLKFDPSGDYFTPSATPTLLFL